MTSVGAAAAMRALATVMSESSPVFSHEAQELRSVGPCGLNP